MKLFPFSRFQVFGNSMLPTLKPGQDVLVFNWWKLLGLKVGDLVVVNVNSKDMVKRIQMSSVRGIFVTGDNPKDSLDSRKFGWVNLDKVLGKVIW